MNILIITFSGKQGSIVNLEFIDWMKDMKLKERLHKLVYIHLIINYLIEFIRLCRL